MTHTLVQEYQKKFMKKQVPQLKTGMHVQVTQTFKEGAKERKQAFKGVIIKMHQKTSHNATFTVRKIVDGIGVEKIFPIHSPLIEIEVVRGSKVRRAKLYYLRDRSGKSTRLKEKAMDLADVELNTEVDKAYIVEQPKAPAKAEATEAPVEEAEVKAEETVEKKEEVAEAPKTEEKAADTTEKKDEKDAE